MKKITNLNIFKKILKNKEKNTTFIDEKSNESIHNSSFYRDNVLVNAIDTPFIVLKHNNNKIHFINNAAIKTFNLRKEDNIFHTFRTPEFHENITKIKNKKASKSQFILELFNVPQAKFFNVKMYRLPDKNTLLSFIDITRLQLLENLRTDFIGNVSHELKTPLSTIINIIELLEYIQSPYTRLMIAWGGAMAFSCRKQQRRSNVTDLGPRPPQRKNPIRMRRRRGPSDGKIDVSYASLAPVQEV